jgi:glycosyltransferase involved in cell wall biosynthesis
VGLQPGLSVILPAYNEAEHLYEHLQELAKELAGRRFEIVVVDDGSLDSTLEECRRAASEGLPVRDVRSPVNEGKGAALSHGFDASSGTIVAFLDADLEIAPKYLARLEHAMVAAGADGAVGVRRLGSQEAPWSRRAMSGAYRRLVRLLFGLPLDETQAGIKLFRRRVLDDCIPRVTTRRFAFDVELLVACQRYGYHIVECPVRRTYTRGGQLGRITGRQAGRTLWETMLVYYRASFWHWLRPAAATKLWMIALGLGILIFGVGAGKLITPLVLQPPIKQVFYVAALQFLPRALRDWLLVAAGAGLALLALIMLNRSLVDAFARRDRGDLAGIWQRHVLPGEGPGEEPVEQLGEKLGEESGEKISDQPGEQPGAGSVREQDGEADAR